MAGNPIRQPKTLLDELLRRRDEDTYVTVLEEFHRTAKRLGANAALSERQLVRLARGESNASASTRRVLAAMFDRSADELLAPWRDSSQPAASASSRGLVLPVASPLTVVTEKELITMAAERAKKFTLSRSAGLPAETLEQVMDDLSRLAVDYQVRPLGEILPTLVELQSTVDGLLDTGAHHPQQARQLYLAYGITGGLLAKASHDLAQPRAALDQARAAYMAADLADHNGLRAWLCGLQALVHYWAGRHQSAIAASQKGTGFANLANSTAAAWLPVSEARSHAAVGNTAEALSAIERAERARTEVREGDELDALDGICTFNQVRQGYYAADALAWLPGEAEMAESYSQDAVAAYARHDDDFAFGDAAGAATDLAIARINRARPDLEGAAEALAGVLQLPPSQRINGVIHSVNRVSAAVRGSKVATEAKAQDLVESIESFTTTTAADVNGTGR